MERENREGLMSTRKLVVFVAVIALLIPAVASAADSPGKGQTKISVCHYPGGDATKRHAIRIAEPAWGAHQAHGDTLGACPATPGTQGPGDGNRAPSADAGDDMCVAYGDTARLDGRGSSDPDGDDLDYRWALTDRPPGSALSSSDLSSRSAVRPMFTPDLLGRYEFELEVDDDRGGEDRDDVRIGVHMEVWLGSPPYGVDEGETISVTIRLHEDAPEDVDVAVWVDDPDVVEITGAPGGKVTIEKGDDTAVVGLHGVEDGGLADESTTLRVSVESAGCADTDAATVVVDDDTRSSLTDTRFVPFVLRYAVV
jgi:hypothetical protein